MGDWACGEIMDRYFFCHKKKGMMIDILDKFCLATGPCRLAAVVYHSEFSIALYCLHDLLFLNSLW
jgi:hypothetical protein